MFRLDSKRYLELKLLRRSSRSMSIDFFAINAVNYSVRSCSWCHDFYVHNALINDDAEWTGNGTWDRFDPSIESRANADRRNRTVGLQCGWKSRP